MARILIIDDDQPILDLLRMILEKAGYAVVTASDAKEGLAWYRAFPTDLIITDLIMPGKEGLVLIADLVEEYPEVKIIAISGGSNKVGSYDYLDAAKSFGACCILPKPFGVHDVLGAVQEWLPSGDQMTPILTPNTQP